MDWTVLISSLTGLVGAIAAALSWIVKLGFSKEFKAAKEAEISSIQSMIEVSKQAKDVEIQSKAVELESLFREKNAEIKNLANRQELEVEMIERRADRFRYEDLRGKDSEIQELKSRLNEQKLEAEYRSAHIKAQFEQKEIVFNSEKQSLLKEIEILRTFTPRKMKEYADSMIEQLEEYNKFLLKRLQESENGAIHIQELIKNIETDKIDFINQLTKVREEVHNLRCQYQTLRTYGETRIEGISNSASRNAKGIQRDMDVLLSSHDQPPTLPSGQKSFSLESHPQQAIDQSDTLNES